MQPTPSESFPAVHHHFSAPHIDYSSDSTPVIEVYRGSRHGIKRRTQDEARPAGRHVKQVQGMLSKGKGGRENVERTTTRRRKMTNARDTCSPPLL